MNMMVSRRNSAKRNRADKSRFYTYVCMYKNAKIEIYILKIEMMYVNEEFDRKSNYAIQTVPI